MAGLLPVSKDKTVITMTATNPRTRNAKASMASDMTVTMALLQYGRLVVKKRVGVYRSESQSIELICCGHS